MLQNGLAIGQNTGQGVARVGVGRGNDLVLRTQPSHTPELYIGPVARLVIRRGGHLTLEPNTRLTVARQLVVEAVAASAQVQTVGRGRLRLPAPRTFKS